MKLVKPKIEINLKLIYLDGEVKHRSNALQKRAENINSLASQFIFRQNQNIHLSELIGSLKQLSGPVNLSGETK